MGKQLVILPGVTAKGDGEKLLAGRPSGLSVPRKLEKHRGVTTHTVPKQMPRFQKKFQDIRVIDERGPKPTTGGQAESIRWVPDGNRAGNGAVTSGRRRAALTCRVKRSQLRS